MDKMWPSFLKDGDTLREAAALFIKRVPETKTNSGPLVCSACRDDGSQFHGCLDPGDNYLFPKSIADKSETFMFMLENSFLIKTLCVSAF